MSYYTDVDEELSFYSEIEENHKESEIQRKRAELLESRKIKSAVRKELAAHGIITEKPRVKGAKVEVSCENCKVSFLARVSDRKRGWGRFCSKSCKAGFGG